jgi:hypothetical protein
MRRIAEEVSMSKEALARIEVASRAYERPGAS